MADPISDRRRFLQRFGLGAGALVTPELLRAPAGTDLPLVPNLDPRPLIAHVRRVLAATESLGTVPSVADRRALDEAFTLAGATQRAETPGAKAATDAIQRVLDRSCLVGVHINPEARVRVARGAGPPALTERGWRPFLVKVHNEAGTTAALRASALLHRWLDLEMFDHPPLRRTLSGAALEYRIVLLYSHEAGQREASLAFDVGQGSQDIGFRNEVPILFDCRRAVSPVWSPSLRSG